MTSIEFFTKKGEKEGEIAVGTGLYSPGQRDSRLFVRGGAGTTAEGGGKRAMVMQNRFVKIEAGAKGEAGSERGK